MDLPPFAFDVAPESSKKEALEAAGARLVQDPFAVVVEDILEGFLVKA